MILVICIPYLAICCSVVAAEDRPKLTVTVTPEQSVFLLGEPVALLVSVKNHGSEPVREIRAEYPHPYQDVHVLLSRDGKEFSRYDAGITGLFGGIRKLETLKSGGQWSFTFRILYSPTPPHYLALEKAGNYSVKLRYPLISRSGVRRQWVESEACAITIKEPEKVDEGLWRAIQNPQVLCFLHRGEGGLETALNVASLLQAHPKSPYARSFRYALRVFYYEKRFNVAQEDLRRILAATGDIDVRDRVVDNRLDTLVRAKLPPEASVGAVLAALQRESGVELRASASAKDMIVSIQVPRHDTRTWMDWLRNQTVGYWSARGNGFLLRKIEEPEKEE